MKKLLAALLSLSLIIGVSACTLLEQDDDDRESNRETTEETEETEETTEATTAETTEETTEATTVESIEETTEATSAISDLKSKLTVTVPEGWEDISNEYSLFQYQNGVSSFILIEDPQSGSGDLEQDSELYVTMLEKSFDGFVIIAEPEIYDMNGIEALRFTFDVTTSGLDMRMTYFMFYVDSSLCYGTAGSLKDTYIEQEAEMNQLITTAISVNE